MFRRFRHCCSLRSASLGFCDGREEIIPSVVIAKLPTPNIVQEFRIDRSTFCFGCCIHMLGYLSFQALPRAVSQLCSASKLITKVCQKVHRKVCQKVHRTNHTKIYPDRAKPVKKTALENLNQND